ncbi:MAG: lysozyme [Rhodospirillaceae bacterium]|nr:lysozyme [Rhodospirillaceae bacterium]
MKTSQAGIDLIKAVEGCKLEAYLCPAKVWTIGYGHTGPDVYAGLKINKKDASRLLKSDLAEFEATVSQACPKTTQSQFDAMVSLCYNIGSGAFKKSSVARLHNQGRHGEAQQAFALWNKAGGKVLPGLVTRRAKEADLYDNDSHTEPHPMPQAVEGEKPTSRVITGSTVGGVTLAGTALKESGLDWSMFTEIKNTVLEVMPYLQGVNWGLVIAGIGLCGVAYAIYARWQDRREGRA